MEMGGLTLTQAGVLKTEQMLLLVIRVNGSIATMTATAII